MNDEIVILIVDDIEVNRVILKGIFEQDYKVIEADDGTTALDILNRGTKVDIILLDIIMPVMNGIDFLKEIKKNKSYSEIPVIVNTQAGEQENEYKALALGADDFIAKPYNPKIIKRRITNIIEKTIYQRKNMKEVLEDTQHQMYNLIDTVPGGIGIIEVSTKNEKLRMSYFNDGLSSMLGYMKSELQNIIDNDIYDVIYGKDEEVLKEIMNKDGEDIIHCKIRLINKNKNILWTGVSAKMLNSESESKTFHVVFMDLTEEMKAETTMKNTMMELKYRVERDTLTGLNNRDSFYASVEKLMKKDSEHTYVIGMLNVDRFKIVNELFGSKNGDMILKNIADVLKKMTKKNGTCARFEADRFAICTTAEYIDENIGGIEQFLIGKDSWNCLNYPIFLHAGFCLIDDKDIPVDLLCDRANMALQEVKGNYITRWNYYNDSLKKSMLIEQELINEMDHALENHEFVVYYQPIVDVRTKKTISAEALVRWLHPKKGMISPGIFIPAFEKNGFITKLDMYVCEEVCRHQREEKDKGNRVVPVSVNLSRINFYNENLYKEVLGLLDKYNLKSEDIKLEITESAYEDNPQDLIMAIHTLQKYGFKVLMDDFGSGYSSLNMLKDCCFDILKIDMKFMDDLEQSERAGNIIYTIIQLAKNLQIETVVEGVENEKQYEMLRSMGCDNIQGYYFSKPVPEDAFVGRLENESGMKDTDEFYDDRDTILVADDSGISRFVLKEALCEKYNIIEASNAAEAMDVLKKNFSQISLVICDIYMPEMSGFDMLKQIKQISFLRKIPVVVVTAYGDFENEAHAIELGAIEVINKPFNTTLLKKRIDNIINIFYTNKYVHAAIISG